MINAPASEIRSVQQRRLSEGVYSEFPSPGLFEGSVETSVSGLYAGAVGLTLSTLDPLLSGAEDEGGISGFAAGLTRKALVDEYDRTRPNPNTTGKAAQLLYSLTSVIPQAAAATSILGTLGGSAATGYIQGYTDYRLARKEGLDEATARKRGLITGLTMGAAVAAPASLGTTLPVKVGTGAGMNVALGAAQRGLTSKILDDAGYPEMADQYKIFDGWSMAADAILGGTFGGIHAIKARDAGLTVNDALQFEESGFGIPTDGKTRSAHTKAMGGALEQLLKGEEVNVADHFIKETNFIPKPVDIEAARAYEESFKELGLADLLDEAKILEDQAAAVQERITVYDTAGTPREVEVVARSEAGTTIVRDGGVEKILDNSDVQSRNATDPEFRIETIEGTPKVSEIDDVQETLKRLEEKVAAKEAVNQQVDDLKTEINALKNENARRAMAVRKDEKLGPRISENLVQRPLTLRGFVRKNGGIDDSDGWLKKQELHKDSRFKGVIKKTGMPLDKMARLAQEAGYFEAENPNRPSDLTADDLVQALLAEQGGNDRYSLKDAHRAQKYLDKLAEKEGKDQETQAIEDVKTAARALGFELNDAEAREVAILEANGYDLRDAVDEVTERSAIKTETEFSERDGEEPQFENDIPFDIIAPKSPDKEASALSEEAGPDAGRDQRAGSPDRQPEKGQDLTQQILAEKPDMEIPLLDVPEESAARIAARNADKRIRGKVAQKGSDFGLFDAENERALASQGDIFDAPTVKAADAISRADAEIKAAESSSKIFDAAVNCFLRKGQ